MTSYFHIFLCVHSLALPLWWHQNDLYSTISESEVAQWCPTLCDPVDCSLSGSTVHGIFQARVLEWIAISFSRVSSRPRNRTRVSCIAGRCFTVWATREAGLLYSTIMGAKKIYISTSACEFPALEFLILAFTLFCRLPFQLFLCLHLLFILLYINLKSIDSL